MHPEANSQNSLFDDTYFAASIFEKIIRSLQLGPKYYLLATPRYLMDRRKLNLSVWDPGVLFNPLRELRRTIYVDDPLPPKYDKALKLLADVGARMMMPAISMQALTSVWWKASSKPGDVIECGAFEGTTSLLIALLGRLNHINQKVLVLDTFAGMPEATAYDHFHDPGMFAPDQNQTKIIRERTEALGLTDRIEVHQGLFADTFAGLEERNLDFSFVHIDANIYQSTLEACEFAIPKINSGGIAAFDDYNGLCDLGARLAIDQYFDASDQAPKPLAGCSAYVQL